MLKNRLVYGFTLVLFVVLAIVYEHRLTYIPLYALLLMAAASFALFCLGRGKLKAQHSLPKTAVEKGESVVYTLVVENTAHFGGPLLQARFTSSDGLLFSEGSALFYAPAHRPHTQGTSLTALLRGKYAIAPTALYTYDMLGLFRRKVPLPPPLPLAVLPGVLPVQGSLGATAGINSANGGITGGEDFAELAGTRPYQQADELRHIHWKLSAATSGLVTKQYQSSGGGLAVLLLDIRPLPGTAQPSENPAQWEDQLLEGCASLAAVFVAEGSPVLLLYPGRPETAQPTLALDDLRTEMAGIHFTAQDFGSWYATADIPAGSSLYACTPCINAAFLDATLDKMAQGHAVTVILPPGNGQGESAAALAQEGIPHLLMEELLAPIRQDAT